MSENNRVELELRVFIALIVLIIIGNYLIHPPVIFHNYGHLGIIKHPVECIKDLFWGWGYNHNCFIFSLKGLQSYFNMIFTIYKKFGVFKATFVYFTQFSPVWGFVPLKLLYDSIIEFMTSTGAENITAETTTEGADNE